MIARASLGFIIAALWMSLAWAQARGAADAAAEFVVGPGS
jgi:hypothetical protein